MPILLAIVLLVWFFVLHLVGRMGGSPLRPRTSLTGWCLIASFLLLWMTPSKWTHHFGSLSGVGPAFIALLIATGVPALQVIAQRHGIPKYLPWVVAASLVPAIALVVCLRNSKVCFGYADSDRAGVAGDRGTSG